MGSADLLSSPGFAAENHKFMANNLANIDTPGYRLRDLSVTDFEETMQTGLEKAERANPNLPRLDVPTVAMQKNSDPQSVAANLLRSQVQLLRAIIAENAQ